MGKRHMPVRLQGTQVLFHNTPRRKTSVRKLSNRDLLTDGGSYDLSAYFLFRDDQTVEDVLTSTNGPENTHVPLHYQQQDKIKFEFDPNVSFDLGICPVDHEVIQIEKARQEESSQLVDEKPGGRKVSGRLIKHLEVNPHNKFLERCYDADRIQKGLAMIDSIALGRNKTTRINTGMETPSRITHEPILEDEFQLPIELAVDEGSEIAGFSVRPSAPFDSPVVKNNKERVTFVEPNQDNKKRDIMDNRSRNDPFVKHPIPSLDTQGMEAGIASSIPQLLERPSHKNSDGHVDSIEDDDLSVKNVLAVDRFISAPRLCKGTKSIPSFVYVEATKDSDRDFMLLSQHPFEARNPGSISSIFRPTTGFSSISTPHAANQSFSSSEKSLHNKDGEGWNRVKHHLEQLPFIMYVPSDWSDEMFSIGSRRSLNSPKGINDFNERRPWRKGNNKSSVKSNFHSSEEKELIRRLKYRIKMLLSNVNSIQDSITENSVIENSSIHHADCFRASRVHRLKSRLRCIEASYSGEEVREHSNASVEALKARLRKIELDFGKSSKIPIQSLAS